MYLELIWRLLFFDDHLIELWIIEIVHPIVGIWIVFEIAAGLTIFALIFSPIIVAIPTIIISVSILAGFGLALGSLALAEL